MSRFSAVAPKVAWCLVAAAVLATQPALAAKVVLRFAHVHGGADAEMWKYQLREFEKAHPNISVKLEVQGFPNTDKILAAAAGGSLPDLFYLWSIVGPRLGDAGMLMNLRPYIKSSRIDVADYICPDFITGKSGQLYGLPYDTNGWFLVYNKKLFTESGMAIPGKGSSWDDMGQWATKLTKDTNGDGKPEVVGFTDFMTGSFSEVYATNFGGSWFSDGKPSADSPQMKQALGFWAGLVNKNLLKGNSFDGGKAAMTMRDPGGVIGPWSRSIKFAWGGAPIPVLPGIQGKSFGFSGQFCISASTKHPKETWELMQYLTGKEAQSYRALEKGWPPGHKGALPAWRKFFTEEATKLKLNAPEGHEYIISALLAAVGPSYLSTGRFLELDEIISRNLNSMMAKKISSDDCAVRTQKELLSFMATRKKR